MHDAICCSTCAPPARHSSKQQDSVIIGRREGCPPHAPRARGCRCRASWTGPACPQTAPWPPPAHARSGAAVSLVAPMPAQPAGRRQRRQAAKRRWTRWRCLGGADSTGPSTQQTSAAYLASQGAARELLARLGSCCLQAAPPLGSSCSQRHLCIVAESLGSEAGRTGQGGAGIAALGPVAHFTAWDRRGTLHPPALEALPIVLLPSNSCTSWQLSWLVVRRGAAGEGSSLEFAGA